MGFEAFTHAYIETALWSSTDDNGGEPLDSNYDHTDLTDEVKRTMMSDCQSFYDSRDVQRYLASAASAHGYTDEQAGHDFWLTRNGHGVGFWDRGLGSDGVMLTDSAEAFGSADLYVSDGKIHHG